MNEERIENLENHVRNLENLILSIEKFVQSHGTILIKEKFDKFHNKVLDNLHDIYNKHMHLTHCLHYGISPYDKNKRIKIKKRLKRNIKCR